MAYQLDNPIYKLSFSPNCSYCKHLRRDGSYSCLAFPSGIPPAIWNNDKNHNLPYPGDNGVVFEALQEAPGT